VSGEQRSLSFKELSEEVTATASRLHFQSGRRSGRGRSNLRAFPIAVLDEEGHAQKSGEIGEIVFDYTSIARPWKKYLRANPNRRGRYIFTGDLGKTDTQGNVYIVGRKSRFIKVRGNRVEPAAVFCHWQ